VIGFNIAQLLKSTTGTARSVEVDEQDPELAADLHLVSPVRGSLRLMRTSSGVLAKGQLSFEAEFTCSRCLELFARTQAIKLNDEFLPVVDVSTGVVLPEPEDPDTFRLTADHLLDLNEAIRQYSIVEAPLQPLCSEGCKGLCSQCGANLNLGSCGCQPDSVGDPNGTLGEMLAERMRRAGFKTEQE